MENNNHVHIFRDYVIPSTCKENGYILHRCDCGYEHRDNFRPLSGHNFVVISETAPTCTENGSRVICCTVCGHEQTESIPSVGHYWGGWQIQKFPTCTEEGTKMHICTRCGMKEEESVPATGHKLTGAKKGKDSIEYLCANCGETISHPTTRGKMKNFWGARKKSIIATLTSIVLVIALVIATFSFFIPSYHYSVAVKALEGGNYTEAYYALRKCNGIKDSVELLDDFWIDYEKTVRTNIEYDDGEVEDSYSEEERSEFEFYENGKIKSSIDFDENGNTSYRQEYDEKGNIKVIAFYSSYDGNLTSETKYEYDENDQLTRVVTYDMSGNVNSDFEYRNKYDQNGNVLITYIYEDGKLTGKSEYEYDKNGNAITWLSYDSYGNMTEKHEYEYDSKGNMKLVVQIMYDSDGEIENKSVIKYKYYKNGKIKSHVNTMYNEYNDMTEKMKGKYTKDGQLDVLITYDDDGEITDKTSWEYFNPQIVYAPKNK